MKKRVSLIIPFLTFFFISVLSLAFGYLFAIIYPAMGLPFTIIFRHIYSTFFIAFTTTIIAALILYRFLKPIDRIINRREEDSELTESEKQKILTNEKIIKFILILTTILGFFIAPCIATIVSSFRDGLLRWSTIRFLIVSCSLGPASAFFMLLFFSYKMQKIKLAGQIYEFSPEKRKTGIKIEVIATFVSFTFFIIVIFTCQAISRDEIISGVSHVALYTKKGIHEETKGYFSELLTLCKHSSDPVVKKAAQDIYYEWEKKAMSNAWYIIFIGAVAFLFLIVCIVLYAFNISSHLNAIKDKLKSLVKLEGDLTTLLVKTSSNEIGDIQVLFNILILNINKMLRKIFNVANDIILTTKQEKKNIEMLLASNKEIKETSEGVSSELSLQKDVSKKNTHVVNEVVELIRKNIERITRQSSIIEESSAAVIEMNAAIKTVSEATKRAADLGKTLNLTSNRGIDVTSDMQNSINRISKSGIGINDIVNTIVTITGQTDLLAMNAAIEAAHAGEYGKGFAVVADEIRKLSEDTALQTKEIENILSTMNGSIINSVSCSQNLNTSMNEITNGIGKTIRLIDEIYNATHEQLSSSNQNLVVIQELVDMTRIIMDNFEQQNRMNEHLLSAIAEMEKSVERLTIIGEKQDGYFKELGIHFESFLQYFTRTKERLNTLETMLESVRLIKNDYI